MAITFQKRQKEMKRLEKQREKAERRAQRKIASRLQKESLAESTRPAGNEATIDRAATPAGPAPQD
jgi:threonyl-tRNA synthetase